MQGIQLPKLPGGIVDPYNANQETTKEVPKLDFSKKVELKDEGYSPLIDKKKPEDVAKKFEAAVEESKKQAEAGNYDRALKIMKAAKAFVPVEHKDAYEASLLEFEEKMGELAGSNEGERKIVVRAKELMSAEKSISEVTGIINEEFGTDYTWQRLNALVKK